MVGVFVASRAFSSALQRGSSIFHAAGCRRPPAGIARASSLPDSLESIVSVDSLPSSSGPRPPHPNTDAIIVLGGGLWQDKVIPPWAERRLDGAALLRAATSSTSSTSAPPILICGGGSPHGLPVLDESTGQVVHEGTAYAEYLIDVWGLPASSILKESSSYDTVGNGYFSAMIHAVPAGWKRVAVVTSEFHMPRSRAIFETVYELVYRSLSVRIELEFVSVRDEGVVDGGVREVRVEKEAKSLETWRRNMEAIDDLPAFHAWLFSTHICYAVEKQHLFGANPDTSGSY